MTYSRRTFLSHAAGFLTAPALCSAARADTYPNRPIRLFVGFAAGGNFDVVARVVADGMSDRLGQPVIVENRPGASSNLAIEAAVRAPADGYTLVLGGAVNAVNATLFESLNFNFITDLTPVAGLVQFPNVMAVSSNFPATTVPEFIAYAKHNAGKLNQGSSGRGTTQHLAGELFKSMTGTQFAHVPYRGAGPALTDLIGGQIQVLFEAAPPTIEHIKAGTVRALAVTTSMRSQVLPDVPTVAEFVPGYEASGWNGILAPKATPPAIVAKLNTAINEDLADPNTRTRLSALGASVIAGTPTQLGERIATETDKWARIIRDANIRAQ